MLIIISVIGLVALVSLYDYFSAKNWQQVTSAVRNDVVFEKRNKKYGAYAIRRDYNKRLLLIMAGLVGSIGVAFSAYIVVRAVPEVKVAHKENDGLDTVMLDLTPPVDIHIERRIKSSTTSLQDVVKFVEPKVVDEPTDDRLKLVDEKSQVGGFEQKGDEGFGPVGEVLDTVPTRVIVIPEDDGNSFPIAVDEDPQFPGGRAKMVEFLGNNLMYPEVPKALGIQGKCWVRFVVDKNGDIKNVKLTRGVAECPECGKEAMRVVNAMPKWRPARLKGEAVNSYFDLPINFVLE